jgi:hypothetical protein
MISAPVGVWERGAVNKKPDVFVLQTLLKRVSIAKQKTNLDPGKIDGLIHRISNNSRTVKCIKEFQSSFFKYPDGLVEPNRTTIKKLATEAKKIAGKLIRLSFNGKYLKVISGMNNMQASYPSVSGLKSSNPYIKKLITKYGRSDLKFGTDYTNPKYQNISKAGPIPEGKYYLKLRPGMYFERSGGGWGVGGWSIYPVNTINRNMGFFEQKLEKFEIDLPWVRSGFFLHHDGGNDGTAGCIGVKNRKDILDLQNRLIAFHRLKHHQISIEVRY